MVAAATAPLFRHESRGISHYDQTDANLALFMNHFKQYITPCAHDRGGYDVICLAKSVSCASASLIKELRV